MSSFTLSPLGQAALRVSFAARIDPEINARVVALARAIEAEPIAGVHDVVPTYHAVTVFYNPLTTDAARLHDRLSALAHQVETGQAGADSRSQPTAIPVCYGGERGPDLADVARQSGLTEAEVIAIHAGREYRVFMMGFVPGFAYLGPLDPRISAVRHASPRVKVRAGTVAVAGQQTAVYPLDSPGGWQLIGWTNAPLFDLSRTPPFLLRTGDRVRFDPREALAAADASASPPEEAQTASGAVVPSPAIRGAAIVVVRGGLLTTVQDGGRRGYQAWGLAESGPMDRDAHRLANLLVGNPDDEAALEITMTGPELFFEDGREAAVTGADFDLFVSGEPQPTHETIFVPAGGTLRFGDRRRGSRAYLAIAGGIAVPITLGSRSTHLTSGLGGFEGRRVMAGDRLPLGTAAPRRRVRVPAPPAGHGQEADPVIRVLPGPDLDRFAPDALTRLEAGTYLVRPESNRMGCRLDGPEIPHAGKGEMLSDATITGALQVLPSGHPVLLMVDRQTTGGYPIVATAITADLGIAGQLSPGDSLRFAVCDRAEAAGALIARERSLLARAGVA